MSDTGSSTAAVLPELFHQYLFESVKAALAAGMSASAWASQLATAIPVESGAFTTEPLEKYIALDEDQVVRWRKGDNTYSTLITSQGNEVIIGCATSDAAGATLYKTFRFNIDSGAVYVSQVNAGASLIAYSDSGNGYVQAAGQLLLQTAGYSSPIVIHGSNVNLDSGGNLTLAGIAVPTNNVQATASPTAAENTAAGYPNGSLWTEVDADKLWVKVSESAGTAVWKSTTLA